ncbi:MAG: hypothetical protein LC723_05700, partial [Actinobacteria bacterium]|nr:hypothetical protein [Actinomycetota bacterium]
MNPQIEGPFILGLDIGTSRIKAAMVDRAGSLVGEPVIRSTTFDPEDLIQEVGFTIDELIGRHAEPPVAVATSCFWHGLLFIDDDGAPLGPITSWQDTASADAAALLGETLDPADFHARTGCFIHPSYPMVRAAKAATSFTRHKIARMIGPAEWVMLNLFGADATSPSMASATGFTELGGESYLDEALEAAGVSVKELPAINTEPLAGLLKDWADRWPELETIPWLLAVGDGACAAVGSGCLDGTHAALTIGTSSAVRVIVEEKPVPPQGLFAYSMPTTRYLVGGAASNAGNVLAWARNVFKLPHDAVASALRKAPEPGLEVSSFLAGERAPDWPLVSEGSIEGIRLTTTSTDILRGLIDSVSGSIVSLVRSIDAWVGAETV